MLRWRRSRHLAVYWRAGEMLTRLMDWAEWLYGKLVVGLPGYRRDRDSADLLATYQSIVASAREQGGEWAGLRAGISELVNVVNTAARHRLPWAGRRQRPEDLLAASGASSSNWTPGLRRRLGMAVSDVWLDARIGGRGLLRRPAHAAAAIGTLALGIGGTAAMFVAVRPLLLRPLPYEEEARIVSFWSNGDWTGPEFELVRTWRGPFERLAVEFPVDWTLRTGSGSVMVAGVQATAELFDVLGARAMRGRVFGAGDDQPGGQAAVVLSYGLWIQQFGGDESVLGSSIVLDGTRHVVVGIMPPDFFYPSPGTRFWASLPFQPSAFDYGAFDMVGRLGPDISMATALARLPELTAALGERFEYDEAWDKTRFPTLTPIRERLLGGADRSARLLLGAVAVILLIACANVGALVFGRSLERRSEMALRSALGASRSRLARQVLAETALLALLGAAVGVVVGVAAYGTVSGALPIDQVWRDTLNLDGWLAGASLALAAMAAALIGGLGLSGALRGRLEPTMRAGSARAAGPAASSRVQSGLVVGQLALGVVLIVAAASLLQSIARLRAVDLGIDPTGVIALDVVTGSGDFSPAERRSVLERVLLRISGTPGVQAAAMTQRLPLRDRGWQGPTYAEDAPTVTPQQAPSSYWRHVTPEYFAALGMVIEHGRPLLPTDDERAPRVAVVSRALARLFWPSLEDPVGKRIRVSSATNGPWITVVGVVDDVPMTGLRDEIRPVVYLPWAQVSNTMLTNTIIVRSDRDPAVLSGLLRAVLYETDQRLAIGPITTMHTIVHESIAEPRRLTLFLNLLAGLALIIAAVGVHGTLARAVQLRNREFGVRLALGATPRAIVSRVLIRGLALTAAGVTLGVAGSFAAARAYAGYLFEVPPNAPPALLGASLVLACAALLAAWHPSRRAARADPATVLRSD